MGNQNQFAREMNEMSYKLLRDHHPKLLEKLKGLMRRGVSARGIENRYRNDASLVTLLVVNSAYHLADHPQLLEDSETDTNKV